MTHDEMIAQAGVYCDLYKVRWIYFTDSRRIKGHKGWPDLIMCGSHHFMGREIKTYNDDLSPEQTKWKYQLKAAAIDYDVWRPADFTSGRVSQEIRSLNE